jgi:hypothetical protein
VRAPGGSSRARRSQNSSPGTTVNASQHRNSMHYHGMHNMYNAYKTYNSKNVHNIMLEICRISRIIVKTISIIVVLKVINCPKSAKNSPGIILY